MVYGSTMKIKDLTVSSFSNIYPTTENKGIQIFEIQKKKKRHFEIFNHFSINYSKSIIVTVNSCIIDMNREFFCASVDINNIKYILQKNYEKLDNQKNSFLDKTRFFE